MAVYAMKYLALGLYTILVNTAPFWTLFLSWLLLKETLRPFEVFCLIVAFAGVVIIALSKPKTEDLSE